MRQILAGILAVLSTGLPVLAAPEKPHADQAGFFDDFTDSLDDARWYVSDGWTNGHWQDCQWSSSAVSVTDGKLTLSYLPRDAAIRPTPLCGEVRTKAHLQYGTFEARIRTPRQSAMNAAFFTYTGPISGNPQDEIDIEILTRDPGRITVNTFVAGVAVNGGDTPVTPPFDAAFHDVAFNWSPNGIIWYLDGSEIHRTPKGSPLPTHAQQLFLSLWSSGTMAEWLGRPAPVKTSLAYEIDWVGYTPLGASCLFPASMTCRMPLP